jgi:large subunit ribosomal protein L18
MKLGERKKRHMRITKKMKGTTDRPRLVVFRSKKHIYAQLVNDSEHKVIVGGSSLSKELKESKVKGRDKTGAKEVGKLIAKRALKAGIQKVSFDRAGYSYHGRVKALSEGAREGGLEF